MSKTFSIVALALAIIGLYGVLAFTIAQRTNEIGLRVALGAQRHHIGQLVLSESAFMMLVGSALGVAGALVGQRLIQGLLFGVGPSDLGSMLTAVGVMASVSLCATLVPAAEAARIDPITALRHE